MELLRVQPYQTVEAEIEIPTGYTNEDFTAIIKDMADLSITEQTFTASSGSTITIDLSGKFDTDYYIELVAEDGTVAAVETFEVRRQYSVATSTTASEIETFNSNEELARAIIDSIVPGGFYYRKETIEDVGLGADYFPIWVSPVKLLKVYENNVLIYNADDLENSTRFYEITKDKTAIMESYEAILNRRESAPNILPAGGSDLLDLNYAYRGFPRGFDYKIVLETGYTKVPGEIKRATDLIIDDIVCGRMDYYKRYVEQYNTDQYRVKYAKQAFEGTGNIIVDKILSMYIKSITKIGVL